jgi:acylphosphatase
MPDRDLHDPGASPGASRPLHADGERARIVWRLVRVHGRVQGVGFRDGCSDLAARLGVAGWVRNRRDGTVEALLHGPADRVDRLCAALPDATPATRVDRLVVREFDDPDGAAAATDVPMPAAGAFERRPTA